MSKQTKRNLKGPAPLERNPVILSLMILKEMGVTEAQHPKFTPLWGPLWGFLCAYRDSMPPEKWNQNVMDGILSGDADFDSGPAWTALNQCLNDIWERASAQSPF